MVVRGFLVIYLAASASWLTALFISPTLGALLSAVAAYGFIQIAKGFETWNRQRCHASYGLAVHASRGTAVAVALVAPSLAVAPPLPPQETWGVRLALYVVWTGLWILYYYTLQVKLEDSDAPHRYPLTRTALSLSVLLSPVLTEGLPAPPETKLALAASMYAGYLPPLNTTAFLVALLAR